jgi:hypothetical protein
MRIELSQNERTISHRRYHLMRWYVQRSTEILLSQVIKSFSPTHVSCDSPPCRTIGAFPFVRLQNLLSDQIVGYQELKSLTSSAPT